MLGDLRLELGVLWWVHLPESRPEDGERPRRARTLAAKLKRRAMRLRVDSGGEPGDDREAGKRQRLRNSTRERSARLARLARTDHRHRTPVRRRQLPATNNSGGRFSTTRRFAG